MEKNSADKQQVVETMQRANKISKIRGAFGIATGVSGLAVVAARSLAPETVPGNIAMIFTAVAAGVALVGYLGLIVYENKRDREFHDALANRL